MTEQLTSYKFACILARYLDEKIAKDISILNISSVSSFADYFVICSAPSNTQVKSLTENVADKVKKTFTRLQSIAPAVIWIRAFTTTPPTTTAKSPPLICTRKIWTEVR